MKPVDQMLRKVDAAHNGPDPEPLPDSLPRVKPFDHGLLPDTLASCIERISETTQAPADYAAVAAVTGLSNLVARQVGIRPLKKADWTVSPNLWGMLVGRPAAKKSPTLAAATRPLITLEDEAEELNEIALAEYEVDQMTYQAEYKAGKTRLEKGFSGKSINRAAIGETRQALADLEDRKPNEPQPIRFVANDATVEKIADLQQGNPCILLMRDELAGFFASLERQGQEAARAYYLEAWNGISPFFVDRIARGSTRIPRACVSVLGSIQPGPLANLMRDADHAGRANDGLMQRFQLAVFPDISPDFRLVDEPTRPVELENIFRRLAENDLTGARQGKAFPYFHFDTDAQQMFNRWLEPHERRCRGDDLPACIESHLSKFQSLIPSLAVIFHLIEGNGGDVAPESLCRAIAWSEYLETHARRIYAPITGSDFASARALAKKIEAGRLGDSFVTRDVYRHHWAFLSSKADAQAAINILSDYGWLLEHQEETTGRPRTVYTIHRSLRRD